MKSKINEGMDYTNIIEVFKRELNIVGGLYKQKIGNITVNDLCDALGAAFKEYDKQKHLIDHN